VGALDGGPDFREHTNTMVRFAISTLGDMPVRATEARFTLPLIDPNTGRRLPRPLLGYYDFVLEGGRVVELKTGRAEYNDTNVRTSIQFAAYLTAMDEHRSAKALDLEILVKTKQPKLQRITLVPTPRSSSGSGRPPPPSRGHRRGPLPALAGVRVRLLRVQAPVPGQR
jgi:hypothetical protein